MPRAAPANCAARCGWRRLRSSRAGRSCRISSVSPTSIRSCGSSSHWTTPGTILSGIGRCGGAYRRPQRQHRPCPQDRNSPSGSRCFPDVSLQSRNAAYPFRPDQAHAHRRTRRSELRRVVIPQERQVDVGPRPGTLPRPRSLDWGFIPTGERSVGSELQSGTLVRLLPDWEIGSSDIHVILPAGRVAKASARAFADFIVANMREIEGAPPKGAKRYA